jgi:hypothetical protein
VSHVAPHRWADAWAGRLGDRERQAMERHAAACRRCARQRDRIRTASDSFPALRAQTAPELPWDSVRAGIHWAVSKARREERRARPARPARRRLLPAAGFAALGAGALALALATGPIELDPPGRDGPAAGPAVAPAAPAPAAPRALAGLVNRATGDVMIDGLRRADLFARALGPGAVIATGDGRVDVQFAEAGALALGPGSRLELRRFDAEAIELVIEGTVDVELAPRAPARRFAVVAGDRRIEVRGTQFRVRHEGGATAVACSRGRVAVRDRGGVVEVGAARRLELAAGHAAAAEQVAPLLPDELAALAAAAPLRLAMWNPEALLQSSTPLEIAGVGRREVRIDGVEVGTAPLRVRVMPGRHTIETADAAGRFRRAGWVDVPPPAAAEVGPDGAAGAPAARFELPVELPSAREVHERRRQLQAGIDRARLHECTRRIAKQGLTGTYVQIELRVDGSGAVNFLNVVDTDLGSATAGCVRRVLADVRFPAGAAATWRERLEL